LFIFTHDSHLNGESFIEEIRVHREQVLVDAELLAAGFNRSINVFVIPVI